MNVAFLDNPVTKLGDASLRQGESPSGLPGLGVVAGANRVPDLDGRWSRRDIVWPSVKIERTVMPGVLA
jgi:hypothetical protein